MSELDDFHAEQERKEKELFDALESAPIQEITGIVDASGAAGVSLGQSKIWTFKLALTHWRVGRSGVFPYELSLMRKCSKRELDRWMDSIKSYAVVRIQAKIPEEVSGKGVTGVFESLVSPSVADEELLEISAELQKPVFYVDPVFGSFTLERRVGWFQGATEWEGTQVAVILEAASPDEVAKAVSGMMALRDNASEWSRRIVRFALDELLPLKNECWLDESEAELGPEEFIRRMKLEVISVGADDTFSFSFNDGDLFWGHLIVVSGTLAEGPDYACISG